MSVRREVAGGVVIKWQRSDNAQKMNPLAGKGGSAPPDIDLSNVQPLVITNTVRSYPIYKSNPGKCRKMKTRYNRPASFLAVQDLSLSESIPF